MRNYRSVRCRLYLSPGLYEIPCHIQTVFRDISTCTVNVEIFAQFIFSHISCRALDVQKFDVSEYASWGLMPEYWSARKYLRLQDYIIILSCTTILVCYNNIMMILDKSEKCLM